LSESSVKSVVGASGNNFTRTMIQNKPLKSCLDHLALLSRSHRDDQQNNTADVWNSPLNRLDNPSVQRKDLLGFFTHPGTTEDYLALVQDGIETGNFSTIYYHNLHTVYLYLTSDAFRKSFNGKYALIDGMILLFLFKLAGCKLDRRYRVTYVEFIEPLIQLARNNQWRVFHLGQDQSTLQEALAVLRQKVPGVQIDGHNGYFDLEPSSDESSMVIEKINAFAPSILLVGLGSPAQELWVAENRDQLNVPVVLTCGSCMDYVAGKVKAAPRWMSRMGLEAIYRVYADPKRLTHRYVVEPVLLIGVLLRNWIFKRP